MARKKKADTAADSPVAQPSAQTVRKPRVPRKPKPDVSADVTATKNETMPKQGLFGGEKRRRETIESQDAESQTREAKSAARTKAEDVEPPEVSAQFRPKAKQEARKKAEARNARVENRAPKTERSSKAQKERNASPIDDELPIPIWRPIAKSKQSEVETNVGASAESQLAPRRSRSRRRREHRSLDISAEAALGISIDESAPDVKSPPKARRDAKQPKEAKSDSRPAREVVPTPEDAPQIVNRRGVPVIVRDRMAIPPIAFFGAALDEKRSATVLEEIRRAGDSGVHLFSHLVELTVDPAAVAEAVEFAGFLANKTCEIDPKAQIIFRVVFAAPDGWEQKYPRSKYILPGGGVAEPSLCDDSFWKTAEDCLTEFVRLLRKLDSSKSILGVHLERGEWFFAAGAGYDTSPAALEKFRDWVKLRYRDDIVALRAAWFDGSVQFGTIAIPPFEKMTGVAHEQFVRTGRKARRWVDFHLFLSDSAVERIGKLAHAAKKASEGYFIVCVDYGYTFEWSHPANGHLSLGKLLRNPEVDIVAGPPSYRNREPGGSAPFPCPIDSIALNGKLYLSEEDFKTPISERMEPDDFNPVMKTPQALENVHWRGAGVALAHMSGVSWMDTWGNGWLNTPGIWHRANDIRKVLEQRLGAPATDPDVAVFIDERSLAYLVDERAFNLLVQSVRESILRSGMSAGFYLLSDLAHREKFPECRLHVFVNAWDMRPEVRSAIKSRLQRDDKMLFWLYAAGLFDGGRESLERVREVTGIALKPQPFASRSGSTLLNRKNPLCDALPESLLAQGSELEPSYFAIPEDGLVLGEYSQTGLPSFVLREFHSEDRAQRWRSVFLGEPLVTPALFRALGELCGAHVWSVQDDVAHIRPPFLTIHCSGSGVRTIALPNKWSAYNLTTQEWAAQESIHLKFNGNDGSTHLFLVGSHAEIEALLETSPEDLLRVSEIPPRAENTLHLDSILFDVPIMKLGEWVEESWSETMADDLLIKPSMLELESPEESESAASAPRGRRRRGGRRRGGSEETSDIRKEGIDRIPSVADLEMNVVFRKRE